jgi:flagellar hook-length control protein FliK
MTPSLALLVNTPPPSTASSPTPSTNASSGSSSSSDFSAPLAQAYQQQSAARQTAQRPGNDNTSSTGSAQASSSTPARQPSTASSTTTASSGKGTAWNPAQAQGSQKDSDKPAATDPNAPQDPAAAMLALLGQSIPANAAPAPAATTTASTSTVAAGGIAATGTATVTAGGTSGMQVDADDLLDAAKAGDDAGDDALATLADDAADDAVSTVASVMGAEGKLAGATQGAQGASSGSHANPLDALGVVTAPVMQAPSNAQPAAAAHALTMQSSVGTPSFAQELGQHVAWLGGQEIKEARITLHPEELGPLDVKVSVQQTHVDVSFIAQHPNAVHAVQQTLSQLDSMLAHHGLSLGQAQVGQGGNGQGAAGSQGTANAGTASSDASASESGEIAGVVAPVVQAVGLLDMFA